MPKGVYQRRITPWQERFESKVDKRGPDECWPWLGAIVKGTLSDGGGYGRFMLVKGEVRQAHRVAYELWVGPIPDGLQIDHVRSRGCVRRDCCNPRHLEAVTQRENVIRGNGFAGQARKTHCVHGHSLDDALVHHGRRECRECCRQRSRANYYRRKKETSNA